MTRAPFAPAVSAWIAQMPMLERPDVEDIAAISSELASRGMGAGSVFEACTVLTLVVRSLSHTIAEQQCRIDDLARDVAALKERCHDH
jgi:hypothetical protein